jgi:hypothetical protein
MGVTEAWQAENSVRVPSLIPKYQLFELTASIIKTTVRLAFLLLICAVCIA